jgi:hypothetical protein
MAEFFTCIRYHVNWPGPNDPFYLYNPIEINSRKSYYQVTGVPYVAIDGTYTSGGLEAPIWNAYTNGSTLEMTINGTFDEGTRTGQITVTTYAELDPILTNLRLRIALVENDIYYNTPYSDIHNQTFRDMIPNTYGQPITIAEGETVVYTFDFEAPEPLVLENCQLVAFVQCDANRDILQGARADVLGLVSSIDDDLSVPEAFSLSQNYPNPFNAETQIGFRTEGGDVTLEVYNITGAVVKTLVNGSVDAGNHSIVWDGTDNDGNLISSGVYFYKLSEADNSEVKRMTLLK